MKKLDIAELSDDDLVGRFIEAAKEQGRAVLDSDVRQANRMFRYMMAIDSLLRARGMHSRKKLIPLLSRENRFVRYYAAQHTLALAPRRARAILEWNHKYGFDAIAGDAGMLLIALNSGEYKPD